MASGLQPAPGRQADAATSSSGPAKDLHIVDGAAERALAPAGQVSLFITRPAPTDSRPVPKQKVPRSTGSEATAADAVYIFAELAAGTVPGIGQMRPLPTGSAGLRPSRRRRPLSWIEPHRVVDLVNQVDAAAFLQKVAIGVAAAAAVDVSIRTDEELNGKAADRGTDAGHAAAGVSQIDLHPPPPGRARAFAPAMRCPQRSRRLRCALAEAAICAVPMSEPVKKAPDRSVCVADRIGALSRHELVERQEQEVEQVLDLGDVDLVASRWLLQTAPACRGSWSLAVSSVELRPRGRLCTGLRSCSKFPHRAAVEQVWVIAAIGVDAAVDVMMGGVVGVGAD